MFLLNMLHSFWSGNCHCYSLCLKDVDWWVPISPRGLSSVTTSIYAGVLPQTGQPDPLQTVPFPSFWKNRQFGCRFVRAGVPRRTQPLSLPPLPASAQAGNGVGSSEGFWAEDQWMSDCVLTPCLDCLLLSLLLILNVFNIQTLFKTFIIQNIQNILP